MGIRVSVGVGKDEGVGVAEGVDTLVAEDVGVWESVSVCVRVGEDVVSVDEVCETVGGIVTKGNLAAVEAGLDKPHEREIRAKRVMIISKYDLLDFCIEK